MAFREVHSIQLGRHLVAASDLNQGQSVLDQRPYAAVLYDDQVPVRCDWCYKTAQPGSTLMRCAHSKFAHYCSRDHQRAAWRAYYRQESAALAACAPHVPPATVRLAARVLWRRNSEHPDSHQGQQQQQQQPAAGRLQQQLAGGTFSDVEALLSHWQELDDARKLQYAQMAALTREFMEAGCQQQQQQQRSPQSTQQGSTAATAPDPATHLDVKQIALLLARFACNNHTICDDELRPIGVGIYPLGALINHACRPNCVQTFTGPNIIFRTLRAVPAEEQLTISYVELAATRQERRRQLLEQYFFDIDQPQQQAVSPAVAATGDEMVSSMQESGLQRLQLLVQLPSLPGMQQQPMQELQLWTSTMGSMDHLQQQAGQQQQSGCDGKCGAAGTTGNADDQQAQQHVISKTTTTTANSSTRTSSRTSSSPPWPENPADHQLCQVVLLKNADSSTNSSKSGHKGSRQQQIVALPGGMCLLPQLHIADNNQSGPTAAAAAALAGLFQDLEGLGQDVEPAEANETEMSGCKEQLAAMQPQQQGQQQQQQLEAVQWGDWTQVLQAASSSSSSAAANGQMLLLHTAADVVIAAASMLLQVQQLQQRAERLARDGDAAAAVRLCQAALAAAESAGPQASAQLVAATGAPDTPPAAAAAAAAVAAECGVGDGQLMQWGPDTGGGRACRSELARVVLGPQHILRLRVLAGLLVAAVDAAEWSLALQAARQLTPLYEGVYPKVWPNLGLHYAMLAKLEMLLEQPGAAARAAEAAAAILCVTHGSSCGVVHEACRIRYEAEQELAAARMTE